VAVVEVKVLVEALVVPAEMAAEVKGLLIKVLDRMEQQTPEVAVVEVLAKITVPVEVVLVVQVS
jgi:hypothetical protein